MKMKALDLIGELEYEGDASYSDGWWNIRTNKVQFVFHQDNKCVKVLSLSGAFLPL